MSSTAGMNPEGIGRAAASVDQPARHVPDRSRHDTSAEGDEERDVAEVAPALKPKTASRTSWTQW